MRAECPELSWTHKSFLRDAKLKTMERYRRDGSPVLDTMVLSEAAKHVETILIPDAVVWRKYLKLLRRLVEDTNNNQDVVFRFLLTESAVELMDYRNQRGETAAPNERSALKRSMEGISVVADLSLEFAGDEWDTFNYEAMGLVKRCRSAHVRLANALVERGYKGQIVLVMDSKADSSFMLESDQIEYQTMHDVLSRLGQRQHKPLGDVEEWNMLRQRCEEEYIRRNAPEQDDPFLQLSEDEIKEKMENGEFLRGRFHVNRDNVREGYVQTNGETFFIDHDDYNHAFHQDMVFIAPLPESQWGRPVGKRRLVHHRDNEDDDSSDDLLTDVDPVPSARVVAVQEPGRRVFVATLVDQPDAEDNAVLVVPMDIRIPKIRIKTRAWRRFVGERLKVEVMEWEGNYPSGRCVDLLGPIGDLETEVMALLIENQVELEPFTRAAMNCLPQEDWKVLDEHVMSRKDLRTSRRVFSVDPPGCQDIDDTMHAEVLPNGDIEVGVHIADVTHFVEHNSALDLEAQQRGTTFYLVDRRFDMLPSILSSDLCSLHGGVDRLAMSVIWIFSSDFEQVKSTWFGRTVIHNCAAMTYDQADNILVSKPPEEAGRPVPPPLTAGSPVSRSLIPSLKKDLSVLTNLARKMRKTREEQGGAVDLTGGEAGGSELKFTLESGVPQKVVPKEDKEIHHTIAELMILANSYVATKIHEVFPSSGLLRIHRSVDEPRLNELKDVFQVLDVKLESTDGKALASALAQARKRAGNSAFQSLILSLATRSMTEAQYISTGSIDQAAGLRHFGLGLERYTHFTSPIRRYADVVVHKQLMAALAVSGAPRESRKIAKVNIEKLKALPDSNVVSILAGEGIDDGQHETEDDMIDMLTSGASELVLGQTIPSSDQRLEIIDETEPLAPYSGDEVAAICEGLNLHNRLAKQSSFECQGLFLSLYFKDHQTVTSAVVTNLRENGFFVYVPRFDLRGPVYVRDIQGSVQVDPGLLGMPREAGSPPTSGFREPSRLFPSGDCRLDSEEEILEVSSGEGNVYKVKAMDVVAVRLTCEDWDVRARVPQPRLHLVSNTSKASSNTSPFRINSTAIQTDSVESPTSELQAISTARDTVFGVISNLKINPILQDVDDEVRMEKAPPESRNETFGGRIVYGNFVNPDTKSAMQQAAQLNAAEWRTKDKDVDYSSTVSVERSVTLRQQRLAAGKRNAKRSKGK